MTKPEEPNRNYQKILSYPSNFLGEVTSEVRRFINKSTFIQNQINQSLVQCSPGAELGLYLLLWFMVGWHIQQEQTSSPLRFSLTVKSDCRQEQLMCPHSHAPVNSHKRTDKQPTFSWCDLCTFMNSTVVFVMRSTYLSLWICSYLLC